MKKEPKKSRLFLFVLLALTILFSGYMWGKNAFDDHMEKAEKDHYKKWSKSNKRHRDLFMEFYKVTKPHCGDQFPHIKSMAELEKVISSNKKVIIEISSQGCLWCVLAYFKLLGLSKIDEFKSISFYYIETGEFDKSQYDIFESKYEINGVPKILYFVNGELTARGEGYNKNLKNIVREWVTSAQEHK
ncbi:thioredoxin family protein [bacterium]|nr:thioredoxin family protein [bacterium]